MNERSNHAVARIVRLARCVVIAAMLIACLPLAARADLRGYWSFNDGAGTSATDSSGNGINGDLEGAVLPTWTTGFTSKPGDNALSFTAGGQAGAVSAAQAANVGSSRVDLGVTASLSLSGNETISMWLRPNSSSVRQNVFGISYSGVGSIVLENVNASTQVLNGFNFYWGNSGTNNSGSHNQGLDSTAITRDGSAWTHVVFVRDSAAGSPPWTNSKIYFNGVDVTTTTTTAFNPNVGIVNPGTAGVFLGAGYVTSFDGLMDDTAIWNEALTLGEIKAMYNARANTLNPLYQADIDVAGLDQIFQVHRDMGATELEMAGYTISYNANVGSLYPSLNLGEAVYDGLSFYLLLDPSGTGIFAEVPPAPEPSSLMLLGMGTLFVARRRRR